MLDGASRIDDVVEAAAKDGQPALAVTDHGNMYGVLDFYRACQKTGITPIIGTEAYMAGEHRSERPTRKGKLDDGGGTSDGGKKLYYHLLLMAENNDGYRNLIQLASRAFLEGYYYKPRVDWELLAEHSKGLIATTGCLGGQVLQALLADDFDLALSRAGRLQDIFGRDNLFVEVQDHGIPEQTRTTPALLEIATKINAPLVATNDAHYVDKHDAGAHDALLCVQTGAQRSDTERFKFGSEEFYIKSATEMRKLFPEDTFPGACDNTLLIAERANVDIKFGETQLPRFPLPEGFDNDADYLHHLTMEGMKERWGDNVTDEIMDRVLFELRVIGDMGFDAYFLIVWDLIRHAREQNIRCGPGRGSAAGSAVSYCLKITDLDPIKYGLLFERFLNPSRISMPDIDMDFDSRYREEMIRYAAEKYGRDHVAQIVTFSTIKARAAVKDAARVLGFPYTMGDSIAKAMPKLMMGRSTPLAACLEETKGYEEGYANAAQLRQMYELDPDAREVMDVAAGLENLRRQDSIHAAAVVITDQPVTEYAPIQRKPEQGQDPEEAPIVTQYEMHGIEDLGLLKMDFLGLRTLDVIEDTIALVEESQGVKIIMEEIDMNDDETLAMLRRGDSIGIFQLEGTAMRALMQRLAPTSFDDIAALVALYRPGPMSENMHNDYADRKNGRQEITLMHDDLAEVLGETYGLMIYQEEMMVVAQIIAGYSLAEADNLRKACGKKIRELLAQEREKFIDGAEASGYGRDVGERVFNVIEPFADYAFNKSHAYAYGMISYQTAWLKAHYPCEYLAALLTSISDKPAKATVYLNECRLRDIAVSVPDVNASEADFTVVDGKIVFGMSAVRNVGGPVTDAIIGERENGPYTDFYNFCERVSPMVLNKRTVEALIKAGMFDSLGHPRKGLLEVFERVVASKLARRKDEEAGVMSLFQDDPTFDEDIPIPDVEFDKKEKLSYEKEMLSLYVSDHPLIGMEQELHSVVDYYTDELAEVTDGDRVTIAGVITNLERKTTKKGDMMAVFELEDLRGTVEVTVFPKIYHQYMNVLADDGIVVLTGRLDMKEDLVKLLPVSIEPLEVKTDTRLCLDLSGSEVTTEKLKEVKKILEANPGKAEVLMRLSGGTTARLPDLTVDAMKVSTELRALWSTV